MNKSIWKKKSSSVNSQIAQNEEISIENQDSSKKENLKLKSPKEDLSKIDSDKIKISNKDSSNIEFQKDNLPKKKTMLNEINETDTKDTNNVDGSALQNGPLIENKANLKQSNSDLINKDSNIKINKNASTLNKLSFIKNMQDNGTNFQSTAIDEMTSIENLNNKQSNDLGLAEILSNQSIHDQQLLKEAMNKKKAEEQLMLEREIIEKNLKNNELLEKFRELVKNSFEAECISFDGWKVHKSTKNLSISSKLSISKTNIIKVIAILENTDALSVFNYLMDPYKFKNWDKDKIASHCLYQNGSNANIRYIIRKMPLHFTPRDAVLLQFWECNKETCVIYQSSVEHRKIPKSMEYVRVQMEMSGFKIKQNNNDVVINFVMEADLRGNIPKFMTDKLTVYPCFDFFKKLLINYKDTLYNDKFLNRCNILSNNQMFKNISELDIDDIKTYMEQYISKNFDRRIPSSLASVRKFEKLIQATMEPRREKIYSFSSKE